MLGTDLNGDRLTEAALYGTLPTTTGSPRSSSAGGRRADPVE
ncbi:hypothetical protein [Streptomyces amakusaensis]|uniref:Uncharacterized protein n=1 Tax=Streptomyces amakusaensis TaxID=67271 RepID=A0ABW0ALL9_9ACTN